MSINLQIQADERMLKDVEERLGSMKYKARNVLSSALNRALINADTTLRKEIRRDYNVAAGTIKGASKRRKSTASTLGAELKVNGRPLGIDKFKVTPKTVNGNRRKPLKATVKKGRTANLGAAFVANLNGIKIFKRRGIKQYPIDRVFSVSIPQMADDTAIVEQVQKESNLMFLKRVEHEISRLLA